ncbi:MAG: CDP-glycerol glycerophosphotransferase family protein [Lachnospiraceae bacterium]
MNGCWLYIDPGTGAMLFSVLMGVISALFYLFQKIFLKLKFAVSGGKVKSTTTDVIPFVIFSDSKRYWNVFKPICDEFEKRKVVCEYWTASPDDPALDETYEYVKCRFIGEGNKAFAKLNIMSADVCLSTTPGLDVYQWKRSKNVKYYVHTLHAIGDTTMYRMFGLDYYDAVLLSDMFQEPDIRKLEELRKLPQKETCIVGSTYMDSMENKRMGMAMDKKDVITVLAAPSWGDSSILNRYGERFIKALINTGYHIILRPHPQTSIANPELLKHLKEQFPNNDRFEWNFDNDNFEVLSRADVMISDFSGVIFDYSLIFEKPVIYTDTKMDYSPYDASWLDGEVWSKRVLPDIGIELKEDDFERMKEVIDSLIENEKYQNGIKQVKDNAWLHKGEAAVRTVDYLVEKRNQILEVN